ncbi:MAG: hypothetical protein RLZZ246_1184 [Planctomycetota bacterium]
MSGIPLHPHVERWRDPVTGRWAPDLRPLLRRRAILHHLAARFAEAEGVDLDNALWQVLKALLVVAAKGDVAAAKLVLQYLAREDDPTPAVDPAVQAGPPVPAPRALADYMAGLAESLEVLRAAPASAAPPASSEEELLS